MSRETDTPSSGPSGRGGAAYPSGTPPYGTPTVPEAGTGAGGDEAARSEDRKTETTLTTRVRINIPGSRPIPPVVVRKPVSDAKSKAGAAQGSAPGTGTSDGSGRKTAGGDRAARSGGPGTGGQAAGQAARPTEPSASASAPAAQQPAEEKTTSDWFAPRKSPQSKGGSGATPANGTSMPGGSSGSSAPGGPGGSRGPSGSGAPSAGSSGAGPAGGGGRPGGVVGAMSVPGTARPGGTNGSAPGSGLPGATGGPVAPGHGGGTGSFDVTEALGSGPRGGREPRRDDLPYFTDRPGGDRPGGDRPGQSGRGPAGPTAPAGPTTGPVTGKGPAVPAAGYAEPSSGASETSGGPAAGLGDDTAILTPQPPAPEGTPGYPRHDNVSGHTVTSGIPVVSPEADFGRAPGPGGGAPAPGPGPNTQPRLPEPVSPPSANSAQAPKKKGRNKLVLAGGGLVALVGVAYGAGLLMNHSDVPKGTTVLGVDIGGGTRDEAVKKLNDALAERLDKPLELQVAGKTVELQPDKAGLQLDTDATVEDAAGSDYNPVSVIGSLFGQKREVDPVIPVDEEKLQAALEDVAGGAGSMTEGTIKFVSGKAIPVYGKAGQGIDVGRSTAAVEKAFRTQVETGSSAPVAVPTTVRQPTVSKAEVDRMMKEFAEPAMSANVTVQTDPAHSVPMSPEKSLWKFLRVTAVDGKLVDKPDLNALKKLYGGAFDGVLITRANGEKTPVTPQDVYGALREALTSRTDRVAVIDTDPN